MKEYYEFKNTLLKECDLECDKCKRLEDLVYTIEEENDEKSDIIDKLLEKVDELEQRNINLTKAFNTIIKLCDKI